MRGLRWISMSLLSVTLREFKSMFNGVSKVLVRCHYIRRFPEQLSHFGVIAAKNGLGGRRFRPFRARFWLQIGSRASWGYETQESTEANI